MLSTITASPPAMAHTAKINATQTPEKKFTSEAKPELKHYGTIGAVLKERPDLKYEPTPEDRERDRASYERSVEGYNKLMEAHKKSIEHLIDRSNRLPGDIAETEKKLKTATGEEAEMLREHLVAFNNTLLRVSRDIVRLSAEWPDLEKKFLNRIEHSKTHLEKLDASDATNKTAAPSQPQPMPSASLSL